MALGQSHQLILVDIYLFFLCRANIPLKRRIFLNTQLYTSNR